MAGLYSLEVSLQSVLGDPGPFTGGFLVQSVQDEGEGQPEPVQMMDLLSPPTLIQN